MNGTITLKYIPTKSQLADMFTKGLIGYKIRNLLLALNCQVYFKSRGELNEKTYRKRCNDGNNGTQTLNVDNDVDMDIKGMHNV